MNARWIWIFGLVGWLLSLASAQTPAKAQTLAVGDVVHIAIINAEEWSGDFPVLHDGTLRGKGFGQVVAAGKTLSQVESAVVQALAPVLRQPRVRVTLKSLRPALVYVVGFSERSAGPVAWVPGLTLRQVLSSSGPLPEPRDEYQIQLLRQGSVREIDLTRLLAGEIADEPLERDDVVTLVRKPEIKIWVLGSATRPGLLRVPVGTDLYQAIAQAGGLAASGSSESEARADGDFVLLLRRGPSVSEYPLRPSPDSLPIVLEAGDTITLAAQPTARVSVLGFVQKPGEFVVRQKLGVLGALAAAEGVLPEGSIRSVVVIRRGQARVVDASQSILDSSIAPPPLEDGDVIYVRPNEDAVLVLGTVQKPGRVPIPLGQTLRVADALALAGGLESRGSLRRVAIARPGPDGTYAVQQVNLDEFLKDGKIEANPLLKSGDILLFGEPKGVTFSSLSQILSSALLIEAFFRR